jgi:uncharacterized protein involved in exopolysaccharide biosynthesis
MKNNDLQELKPVYLQEANYSSSGEISLISLVAVLLRRKLLIATVFIISISSGVAFALLSPRIYTSSVTIEVGTQIINGSISPFETPGALLAKLQYSYIPQVLAEHRHSSPDDREKYKINSSVPAGSNITLLEIKGNEDQTDTLHNLLQSISQRAVLDHSLIFGAIKKDLESRLNMATSKLEILKNSDDSNKTEIANAQSVIESLNSQLANLRNTRIILPPIRSLEPTGTSRRTIVLTTMFVGICIGIFVAFFAEFWLKVQEKIDEEDKEQ